MLIGFPATNFTVNTKRPNYTGFYSAKRKQITALPGNISVFNEENVCQLKENQYNQPRICID
jgi:hypothetical protein